jgi:hypothetical protein
MPGVIARHHWEHNPQQQVIAEWPKHIVKNHDMI